MHTTFMRKALRLAERGRGRTSPNPMVGAIVVDRDGVIVGRGAHEFAGGPHAEVVALRDAGERARGATLYCTLEPCAHVGRTGPCAPLVADAGVTAIVIATEDPNPVAAGGIRLLRQRGVSEDAVVLSDEARALNAPFFTRVLAGRPFVTMKIAISLDGRIAAGKGRRTQLTGSAANRAVHRDRAELDAIAVGAGTVLVDDPLLTARGAYRFRPLVRIVYDRNLLVSPSARLFTTLGAGGVIIVCTARAIEERPDRAQALRDAGAELLATVHERGARESLHELARRGISSMTVEGGSRLHAAFWDGGLVDRVQMYVADATLGADGVEWIAAPVMSSDRMARRTARPIGNDMLLEGYVHRAH